MRVPRENRLQADPEGDDVCNRPIRNLAEVSKVVKPASGGDTDIDACIRVSLRRIEEIMHKGALHRPELVVVTDGDDQVCLKPHELGSTRLHAFIVENSNEPLMRLANESGGVGISNL